MKKKQRVSAIFIVIGFIMCMMNIFQTVSAAQSRRILLNCLKDDEIVPGMTWHIYEIAEMRGDKIKLTETFSNYRLTLGDKSAAALSDLASTLDNYIDTDNIPALQTGITDENGLLTFSGLETGMYLLTAENLKIDYRTWEADPMLVFVDETKETLVSYPKIRDKEAVLNEGETNYVIRKVWSNDNGREKLRDTHIRVELYCDKVYMKEITLDKSNNWSYAWTDTTGGKWTVKEIEIQENYIPVYRKQEQTEYFEYIIDNTYERPEDSSWFTDEWEDDTSTTSGDSSWMTDINTETTPPDSFTTDKVSETTTTIPAGNGTDTETETTSISTETTDSTHTTNSDSGSDSNTSSTTKTTVTTTTKTGNGSGSGRTENATPGGGSGDGTGSGNTVQTAKIPQTGQLWYPVPILALGGILMIGIGMKLGKKEE